MAAVPEEGRRGLEAGVREGRLQERDHLQGRRRRRPRTRTGTRKTPATRSSAGWPSRSQNAMGPHVHDPRSGEIISAHIIFWHDIVKLAQHVVLRAVLGAQDPRARKLPLPDELTGELLRYVACPRSRPHARPAAQPPGQLGVHHRAAARPEVHREARQRRARSCPTAASTTSPSRRTRSSDLIPMIGAVRLLRHRVGLQADPRRARQPGGRAADARRVGGAADRRAVAALRRRGRAGRASIRP